MSPNDPPQSRVPIRIESSLRIILLVAGLTVIAFGLHSARPVVIPLLLALCLVLAVQPLIEALERRGVPGIGAVSAGMLALLAGLGLFCATVAYGANQLLSELPDYERAARTLQKDATSWLVSKGLYRVAAAVGATQISVLVMNEAATLLRQLPDLLGYGTFVLIVTLFMLIERNRVKRQLRSRLASLTKTYGHVVREIQHYFAIKTLVSLLTGGLAGILCYLFEVPNFALWGVLAFVLNFIPVVGSFVAAIPPVALSVLTGDVTAIVAVAGGYAAINVLIGNVLEPRWLGRTCGLSPLAVVISMVVWGALLGPTGALLSVPLTSGFRIALSHVRDFRWLSILLTDEETRVLPPESRPAPRYRSGTPAPSTVDPDRPSPVRT